MRNSVIYGAASGVIARSGRAVPAPTGGLCSCDAVLNAEVELAFRIHGLGTFVMGPQLLGKQFRCASVRWIGSAIPVFCTLFDNCEYRWRGAPNYFLFDQFIKSPFRYFFFQFFQFVAMSHLALRLLPCNHADIPTASLAVCNCL